MNPPTCSPSYQEHRGTGFAGPPVLPPAGGWHSGREVHRSLGMS